VGSAGRHDRFDGAEGMAATATAAFQSLVASRLSASSHRGSKARHRLFFLIEIGRMFRKFRWQHMATIQGWNARKDVVDVVDVVVEQRFHAHFGYRS